MSNKVSRKQIHKMLLALRHGAASNLAELVLNGEATDELTIAAVKWQTYDGIIFAIEAKEKATGGNR